MKTPCFALMILAMVGPGWTQPAPWSDKLASVRQHAMQSSYSYEFLERLCHRVGPRLSGSPGAAAAVDQLAAEMTRLGLKVRRQPCMVTHWERGLEQAELLDYVGKPAGVRAPLVLTTLGGSSSTGEAGLEANLLMVGSFEELEAIEVAQVKGKIVVFNTVFDEAMARQGHGGPAYSQSVAYRVRGPEMAAQKGAAACLVRAVGGADFRLPHTGVTIFEKTPPIPCAALCSEDIDRIAYLIRSGPVKLRLLLTPKSFPNAPSYNVIGDLPGSDPDPQVVIMSGHLDSWDVGTGALDDAAGVATAMQVASLRRRRKRPGVRPLCGPEWLGARFLDPGHAAHFPGPAAHWRQSLRNRGLGRSRCQSPGSTRGTML